MSVKPILMGAEVEFSMPTAPQPQSPTESRRTTRRRRRPYHTLLLNAIREEHDWLPDIRGPGGIYLDNGARYYLDSGNHNEFSSPELSTPRQIAIYDRAAERILSRAKARVLEKDGVDICVTKNNVNFSMPDRASWGQHEAYMCWIPLAAAAEQLIPHLVSRIPYAGAGYLSANRNGMGFELSQRARHMTRPTGEETTRNRAIFCTRAWKPSDVSDAGWTRTNLISKDSQRCSFGMYLTYGVTATLFMIVNGGHQIGRDVKLKDCVAAMKTFSVDPWLKATVRLANGKQASALDIQRAYFREARPHVESGDYPEWTAEVLEHWSQTLDQLEADPMQLSDRLDPYLKLKIFDHQLARSGMTWAKLREAMDVLDQMRRAAPDSVVSALLNEDTDGLENEGLTMYRQLAKSRPLKRLGLDPLRFAVRLQATELNYHELGGLFDVLSAANQLNHVVVTDEEVQHAMHHPPAGGRAEARSESIKEFTGQPWACDWQCVVNHDEEKWVDLRDPFTNEHVVTPSDGNVPRRRRSAHVESLLERISRGE